VAFDVRRALQRPHPRVAGEMGIGVGGLPHA
jgi:hypothetical protein